MKKPIDEGDVALQDLTPDVAGGDASEADLSVLQHQLDTQEPLGPDEQAQTLNHALQ